MFWLIGPDGGAADRPARGGRRRRRRGGRGRPRRARRTPMPRYAAERDAKIADDHTRATPDGWRRRHAEGRQVPARPLGLAPGRRRRPGRPLDRQRPTIRRPTACDVERRWSTSAPRSAHCPSGAHARSRWGFRTLTVRELARPRPAPSGRPHERARARSTTTSTTSNASIPSIGELAGSDGDVAFGGETIASLARRRARPRRRAADRRPRSGPRPRRSSGSWQPSPQPTAPTILDYRRNMSTRSSPRAVVVLSDDASVPPRPRSPCGRGTAGP